MTPQVSQARPRARSGSAAKRRTSSEDEGADAPSHTNDTADVASATARPQRVRSEAEDV